MKQGQTNTNAGATVDKLWGIIEDFEPSTNTERAVFSQALEGVQDLDKPEMFVCSTSAKVYLPSCGVVW